MAIALALALASAAAAGCASAKTSVPVPAKPISCGGSFDSRPTLTMAWEERDPEAPPSLAGSDAFFVGRALGDASLPKTERELSATARACEAARRAQKQRTEDAFAGLVAHACAVRFATRHLEVASAASTHDLRARREAADMKTLADDGAGLARLFVDVPSGVLLRVDGVVLVSGPALGVVWIEVGRHDFEATTAAPGAAESSKASSAGIFSERSTHHLVIRSSIPESR